MSSELIQWVKVRYHEFTVTKAKIKVSLVRRGEILSASLLRFCILLCHFTLPEICPGLMTPAFFPPDSYKDLTSTSYSFNPLIKSWCHSLLSYPQQSFDNVRNEGLGLQSSTFESLYNSSCIWWQIYMYLINSGATCILLWVCTEFFLFNVVAVCVFAKLITFLNPIDCSKTKNSP